MKKKETKAFREFIGEELYEQFLKLSPKHRQTIVEFTKWAINLLITDPRPFDELKAEIDDVRKRWTARSLAITSDKVTLDDIEGIRQKELDLLDEVEEIRKREVE
jgi:hypothetical protein